VVVDMVAVVVVDMVAVVVAWQHLLHLLNRIL